jgi:uncharacterized protein with ACT and thioredoxin-like domain
MLGQGELTAWAAQAINDLDRHNIRGSDCFFALWQITVDDLVKVEKFPEPQP